MKKSAVIIILIIWFIWSTGKDLDTLIRSTSTADYYIFSTNGLTLLFFIFAIVMFLLDATTVYYLFRPRGKGFYIALSALVVSVVQNIVSVILAMSDLAGVRDAYAAGREMRGVSVRQESLDMMFRPQSMYLILAGVLILYFVIAILIVWKRKYFWLGETKGNPTA